MALVQQRGIAQPELLGYSTASCRFLKNGNIVNLESLQHAVSSCVKQLQTLSRVSVHEVTVNLPVPYLKQKSGRISIEFPKRREIKRNHMIEIHRAKRLIETEELELIHSIPHTYFLDEREDLTSPVGMSGMVFGANVLQVFAPIAVVENVIHSMNKCKFKIRHLVMDPLGSGEALITPDEIELGVLLIDIGGNETRLSAYKKRALTILPLIPLGGDHITSDIAIGIRTPIKEAEYVKTKYGFALPQLAPEELEIDVVPLGGGQATGTISAHRLSEIIQSRVEEMFELIRDNIRSNLDLTGFSGGVILSGGGSMMPGISEIAETYLQLPIIPGKLRTISGLTDIAPAPVCAAATGLALYGIRYPVECEWGERVRGSILTYLRGLFTWFGGDRN